MLAAHRGRGRRTPHDQGRCGARRRCHRRPGGGYAGQEAARRRARTRCDETPGLLVFVQDRLGVQQLTVPAGASLKISHGHSDMGDRRERSHSGLLGDGQRWAVTDCENLNPADKTLMSLAPCGPVSNLADPVPVGESGTTRTDRALVIDLGPELRAEWPSPATMPVGQARRRAGACGQRGARPGPARVMALVRCLCHPARRCRAGEAATPERVTDRTEGRHARRRQRASGRPGRRPGASGGLPRDGVWRAGRAAGTLAAPSLPRGRRQAL